MDFDEAVSAHSLRKRELRCNLVKGECSLAPLTSMLTINAHWANGSCSISSSAVVIDIIG